SVPNFKGKLTLISKELPVRLAGVEVLELLVELGQILEVPVHGGEADVRDVVPGLQPFHHHLPQPEALDLHGVGAVQRVLDLLDQGVDVRSPHGPLGGGHLDAAEQLAAVVGLDLPPALHHLQRPLLHVLVGGEAAAAAEAFAAAAHRPPLAAGARVDDAVFHVMADGTAHEGRRSNTNRYRCRGRAFPPAPDNLYDSALPYHP